MNPNSDMSPVALLVMAVVAVVSVSTLRRRHGPAGFAPPLLCRRLFPGLLLALSIAEPDYRDWGGQPREAGPGHR